ncbi:hypothetical protein GCM10009679_56600 [Saccharothrix algeriensis]|uniref:Trypsin-co-occurring domain-containing protein n=2 Tax=Catellatospora bangladeshensis TaxID=310355 RepID=A0A8J3NKF7_9ACTN|nr:hypothetical protein Cba03nite_39500 [Catellatospora bangladeshensis]
MDGMRPATQQKRDIVDLDLGNGRVLRAEVFVEPSPSRAGEGSGDAGLRDWWKGTRQAALDRTAPAVEAAAQWVHDEITQLGSLAPDRVGVELGVKFVARTPDLIVPVLGQVGAEATLLVRLEWEGGALQRRSPQGEEDDLPNEAGTPDSGN